MKIKSIFSVFFTALLTIVALAIFASSEEIYPSSTESAVTSADGAVLGDSQYDVPEVEAKPPVAVKDNSAELSAAADVVFSNGKTSGYVILYGTVGTSSASSAANDISDLFYKNGKASVDFKSCNGVTESAKEILVGKTDRALSTELAELVDAAAEGGKNYAWGYAVKDGKLAIYAANNGSYNLFAKAEIESLFTATGLTLKEGLLVVRYKSVSEYNEEQDALADAEAIKAKKERYDKAIAGLEAYKGSVIFRTDSKGVVQEGAEIMPSNAYPDPEQYPTYGEHPRVHVNSETLPRLREVFNNPPAELASLVQRVKEYADYDFDGTFPEIPGKTYTYQEKYFKYMEAKAFMYLMTGEELYGYEAILCAKNCILTMLYTAEIFKDTYRGGHHAISIITEIYDWCYDLMTEEDKTQIIDGARFYLFNTLEFYYPPSNMGYISGHGMSYQFLHSYVGFSLAIYDERPDWWDYVGGRFYSQYCLGINYCVQNGYYSQGTTCYAPGKLYNIYISSWMVESATGVYPYDHGLRDVPYFMLSQVMPNNRYFEYGDTPTTGNGTAVGSSWMIIAVGMYDDPTVYAAAKKFSSSFESISENTFGDRITAPNALIFLAGCAGSTEKYAENLPLIEYTGTPAGITVARNAWNDTEAAAVYMKVGELNMANHDHRDSGTFQIYYKGLLAPANAGQYNVYGSQHWKYFHQATISDNGLLVFDPDLYEEPQLTPLLDADGKQMIDDYGTPMYTVLNPEKAFYTGSQRAIGEAANFDTLIGQTHDFGTIVAHAEGYKQNGDAKYAYLAGDITSAYISSTASYVGRSMLTVFTDDPDYPMYFFVYDNVTPVYGDDDVIMRFLLHSVTEPTLHGSSVVIENGDGQLVLLNTTENSIETIGGSGKKYWVNGINIYEDTYSGGLSTGSKQTNDNAGKLWGRTEVSAPVGEDGNQMLNVMYVADKGQTEMLTASSIIADGFTGTVIGRVAVFFADNSVELSSTPVTVEVENDSELVEYYFCGLDAGTWKVYLGEGDDRQYLGTTYASNVTHMVTFNAPAGVITLEPGADIKPPNSGKLIYQNVPSGFVGTKYYSYDGITALPTDVVNGNSIFVGWYLDPELTKPVSEIDGSLYEGTLTLFAKYKFMYVNEDYDWAKSNPIDGKNFSKGSINYNGNEDKSVNYKSEYKDGEGYIIWTGSTGGPVITVNDAVNSIAASNAMKYTYTFSLAKNGTDTLLATGARIVSRSGRANNILSLFSTATNGNLTVCGKAIPLTNEFYTFSIELDFAEGKLTAYDAEGEIIGQTDMPLIEDSKTLAESKALFIENILNWRNNGAGGQIGSIRIGQIKIEQGGFFTDPDECLHVDENDDKICDRCKSDFDDGCNHYDDNDDLKCDKCSEAFDDGCYHRDATDDGKCDKCAESYEDGCELCRDIDDDGKCDRCKKAFSDGCDKHRDADDDGVCDVPGCGKPFEDGCDHFDKDDDGKCDKCGDPFDDGCETHRDSDDDGKCDRCSAPFEDGEELPDGQWNINYAVADGVVLPDGAPKVHVTGTVTKLPVKATLDGKLFGGWYLDAAFTMPVTEIAADHAAPVTLYAKWNTYFINDDFSWAESESVDSSKSFDKNGVSYPTDTNFKSYYVDGDGYIVWTTLGSDIGPVIGGKMYSATNASKITYTFSLGAVEDETMITTEFRLVGKNSPSNTILFSLFKTSKDGTLTLLGTYKTTLTSDKLFTFSITIDYENGVLTAYGERGEVLTTKTLPTAPTSETCDEWNEWKNSLTGIMNWRNSNSAGTRGAMKIGYIAVHEGGILVDPDSCEHADTNDDNFCDFCRTEFSDGCDHKDENDDEKCDKCKENFADGCDNHRDADDDGHCDVVGCGKEYSDGDEIPEGAYRVNYVLPDGVSLPAGAPTVHTVGKITALPSAFIRSGYIFVGWYLDPEFTNPIDYIEKTHEDDVTVYPKWNRVLISEDYSWAQSESIDAKSLTKNNITYNSESINYKSYYVDGKGYIVWSSNTSGTVILGNGSVGALNSNKLTFTFSFAKDGETDVLNTAYRLIGRAPGATSNTELFTMFAITDGILRLCGESIQLTDEFFTFSITIDFATGTKIAYDEDGKLIASAAIGAAPTVGEIDSWIEWGDNLAYRFNIRNNNSTGTLQAIRIGQISMYEGGFGEKYVQNIPTELPEGEYAIIYDLQGGTLPEGAPESFKSGETVALPETVIFADPAVSFAGWYLDAAFTQPVTEIPADAAANVYVYAKTLKTLYDIDITYTDPTSTGTVVANRYCYHEGGDTDSDGICNTCGFCAGHVDGDDADGVCEVCGYKIAKCSTHTDVHTIDGAGRLVAENQADKYCDVCGRCPTNGNTYDSGKLGNSLFLQDCDQPYGYGTIVDNGDEDYLHIEGNYSGTLIQLSGAPNVKDVLASAPEKALTFRMVYGCYGDKIVPLTSRMIFRNAENTANYSATLIVLADLNGALVLKSQGGAIIKTFEYGELVDVSFVVDFDDHQIRYYIGDSTEPTLTETFAHDYTAGQNILNHRLSGTGSVDLEEIEITVGDKYN